MWRLVLFFLILLSGCTGNDTRDEMIIVKPTDSKLYSVATIQKITSSTAPVHIYIEGDGRAFNNRGQATYDPTPRSHFMRNMAESDTWPNVVYMARPCQFVMDNKCKASDWTDGRFSKQIVDSMAAAVKKVAASRPVILVGYSGGAMISGLIIQNHNDINVIQWITIAGVLNHSDWTEYFGDTPLSSSMNMNTLPHVSQVHYIAERDKIVPTVLSKKWIGKNKALLVLDANHDTIPIIKLDFID